MNDIKKLPKDLLAKMYLRMEETRQFELKAVELFQAGELPGFLHSCLGQEAAGIGTVLAMEEDDYLMTTHRGHGHLIAKGGDMGKMMAELYGKAEGYCHGKGGSMHIMASELNMLGAQGIVGQGASIAMGAALAAKLQGTKQVSVAIFGDGAQNEGFFHESMNISSIWDLPVLFAIENNGYAESTSQKYHMKPVDIATRAKAYDVESIITDGNDVVDVYLKTKEALEKLRNGQGPILMESKTYRWLGHYVGDPGVYRTQEEVDYWKSDEKEPITRFRKALIENEIFTEEELDAVKKDIIERVEKAAEFGKNGTELPLEAALDDIYQDGIL